MSTLVRPTFRVLTLLCAACTCLVAARAVSSVVDASLQPLPSLRRAHPSATFASTYEGVPRRMRSIWTGDELLRARVLTIKRTRGDTADRLERLQRTRDPR